MGDIQLGEQYKDRFSGIEGAALEFYGHLNGCWMVGLQPGLSKEGTKSKIEYPYDLYLQDGAGESVSIPAHLQARAGEILGKKYRCTVSGLEGQATSVRFMLNGTEQVGIQPRSKDGVAYPEGWSLDSGQLEEIVAPVPVSNAPRVGGPAAPSQRV